MDKSKIERINELARKQRSVGLNDAEKAEQKALRDEYRANIRAGLEEKLDRVYYQMPDGTVVKAVKKSDKR